MARVHLFKHTNESYLDNENKTPTLTASPAENETIENNASSAHNDNKLETVVENASTAYLENNDNELLKEQRQQQPIDQNDAATALQLLGLSQTSKEEDEGDKRIPWTPEEDELLVAGIKKYGYGKWKEIANMIPGRKGKQIKQRWDNTLAAKYIHQENNALLDDLTQKMVEKANLLSQVLQQQQQQHKAPSSSSSSSPLITTTADETVSNIITSLPTTTTTTTTDTKEKGVVDNIKTSGEAETNDLSLSSSPSTATSGLNFADAAALAIYTQHLTQQQPSSSSSNNNYFLPNSFNNDNNNNNDLTAAAVAAVVAAVQQQQQQQQQQQAQQQQQQEQQTNKKQQTKRRRSDPALANTQSDAMTIYASSTPITTNNNQSVYPCLFPNCNKTFVRLYNLKSHSRTHTDDRPFICMVCNAAFSRNHDLKRHSKIHEGVKPYQCNGCHKNFSRLDALKRHKNNERSKTACTNS